MMTTLLVEFRSGANESRTKSRLCGMFNTSGYLPHASTTTSTRQTSPFASRQRDEVYVRDINHDVHAFQELGKIVVLIDDSATSEPALARHVACTHKYTQVHTHTHTHTQPHIHACIAAHRQTHRDSRRGESHVQALCIHDEVGARGFGWNQTVSDEVLHQTSDGMPQCKELALVRRDSLPDEENTQSNEQNSTSQRQRISSNTQQLRSHTRSRYG